MAKIFPSDWKSLDVRGVMGRQIETLRLLEGALGARYSVYHGVHWTLLAHGGSVFDGIDFVIISPAGRIVLIEQQVGLLSETEDGLVKLRADQRRSVPVMLGRAAASLSERLAAAFGVGTFAIDELFYCPDYSVRDPSIAGVPADRIVDARRRDQFVSIIRGMAPADEPVMSAYPRLHRFFCDHLDLVPDTTALRERRAEWVTRLAQGLATWALTIEMSPHRVRVVGTAGSGKTQLALRVLERAEKAGQSALYVCFNRPLADHISAIAPASSRILTYHQLCDEQLRLAHGPTDFRAAKAFQDLERRFSLLQVAPVNAVDVLIVDEGQDFDSTWLAPLLLQVKPPGAMWWLEDPMQNLYHREAMDLPGFVTLRSHSNYRSPRDIVAFLHALLGASARFEAASPFESADLVLSSYGNETELKEETKRAITAALQAGFTRSDIALVSFHGRDTSRLTGLASLGPHRLRSFTGGYDLLGNPVFSDGEVLFESLYRFKGQSAPCVILTEVDFDMIDTRVANKLFVAATRASMQLMIVASTAATERLVERAPSLLRRENGPLGLSRDA